MLGCNPDVRSITTKLTSGSYRCMVPDGKRDETFRLGGHVRLPQFRPWQAEAIADRAL